MEPTDEELRRMHHPDGRETYEKSLLLLVEHIMHFATADLPGPANELQGQFAVWKEMDDQSGIRDMLKEWIVPINSVSMEMSWRCSDGEPIYLATMKILRRLSNYSWDAKAALSVAAMVMDYGIHRLVLQLLKSKSNQRALSLAVLRQQRAVETDAPRGAVDTAGLIQTRSKATVELIKAMIDVTASNARLKFFPDSLQSATEEISTVIARRHLTVYRTILSTVQFAPLITSRGCSSPDDLLLFDFNLSGSKAMFSHSIEFLNGKHDSITQHLLFYHHAETKRELSQHEQDRGLIHGERGHSEQAELGAHSSYAKHGKCCNSTVLQSLWTRVARMSQPKNLVLPSDHREPALEQLNAPDEQV